MKINKIIVLITAGALIIAASLLMDVLGSGKSGIGPAQIFATNLGSLLVLLGVGFWLAKQPLEKHLSFAAISESVLKLPKSAWIVAGFFISYFFLFIEPMFFDPSGRILYFNKYIPDRSPIGVDFLTTLASINSWFSEGTASVFYPPLVNIVFAPLLLVEYPANYHIITIVTVVCFFIFAFILPLLIADKKSRAIVLFIFGISVFSYGLQFELERGQFHTMAMTLCLLSIYIFHKHPGFRFFAYVLFSISVQFKIYPAIFIVMFVDNWQDWKINLRRFAALGVANFLLLFLLGFGYFLQFTAHITNSISHSLEMWNGNHSISAFVRYLSVGGMGISDQDAQAWIGSNESLLESLLMAYFIILFIVTLINSYRKNIRGVDTTLLMSCMIGGLIIPPINHDYTLPLLTAPFALMAADEFTEKNLLQKTGIGFLLAAGSFVYSITLFPFLWKPDYLQNNFPLLMALLTAGALLSFFRTKDEN
jgi:hypothetical protein